MASGCLCCTIRGDLIDTIHDLLARRGRGEIKAFDRIVIETTGLADPAPVLHAVMSEPGLLAACRLEGVITVVDAFNGMATLDAHPEAVKQVAVADRIVLTKVDLLVGPRGRGHALRHHRAVAEAQSGGAAADHPSQRGHGRTALHHGPVRSVEEDAGRAQTGWRPKPMRRARSATAAATIITIMITIIMTITTTCRAMTLISAPSASPRTSAISPQGLELFLELLKSYHGANMLRMKGIVKLADDPSRPVVLHGVQHVFHPPVRLAAWPDGDERTRLVFIVKDIEKPMIEGLFRAFTDQITGGADAFTDKTLSLNR